mmetsp:Transcript_16823/g.28475  ORF Transcript_16823/g.28475 Transcript_16823/m.28475 type:complete len:330 (+) Transcript_16823:4120-5109(+)
MAHTSSRAVHHSSTGQGLLEMDDVLCRLTGLLSFLRSPADCFGITVRIQLNRLGLVAFIKHDKSIEILPATPINELIQSCLLLSVLTNECRVGGKHDTLWMRLREISVGQFAKVVTMRVSIVPQSQITKIPLGILVQVGTDRNPHVSVPAPCQIFNDKSSEGSTFTHPCTITQQESSPDRLLHHHFPPIKHHPLLQRQINQMPLTPIHNRLQLQIRQSAHRQNIRRHGKIILHLGRFHSTQCGIFHHWIWMVHSKGQFLRFVTSVGDFICLFDIFFPLLLFFGFWFFGLYFSDTASSITTFCLCLFEVPLATFFLMFTSLILCHEFLWA